METVNLNCTPHTHTVHFPVAVELGPALLTNLGEVSEQNAYAEQY